MTNHHCQECKQALSLYQCPRCSRRTCSLECCRSHKKRTGCTGKRDRSTFQRLEEMTDATINSDYFFLENVLQTVDGGKRLLKQVGAITGGGTHSLVAEVNVGDDDDDDEPTRKRQKTIVDHLPPKWRRLVQQAKEREVTLLLMPQGMERHKSNTSHFNTKSQRIVWKLEFSIHNDATPPHKMIVSNKVSEETKVIEEWKKHTPSLETRQDLHFMLKKLPCPANKPQYVEVNKESTLGEALKGMTVIENPIIYVVVATELHNFPLLIQEVD